MATPASPRNMHEVPLNDSKDVEKQQQFGPGIDAARGSMSEVSPYKETGPRNQYDRADPFGDEEGAEVKYRTLSWW